MAEQSKTTEIDTETKTTETTETKDRLGTTEESTSKDEDVTDKSKKNDDKKVDTKDKSGDDDDKSSEKKKKDDDTSEKEAEINRRVEEKLKKKEEEAKKKAEEEEAKKKSEPENWDLELPENVEIGDSERSEINDWAKKYGLSKEAVEEGIALSAKSRDAISDDLYTTTLAAYEAESKKEFGDKLKETVGAAERFLKQFGSIPILGEDGKPEKDHTGRDKMDGGASIIELLRAYGMLRHPVFLRTLAAADEVTRDDRGTTSGLPTGGKKELTFDQLYPNSQRK